MQRELARVYSLFAGTAVVALVVSACAGGLKRVESEDPLEKNRPKELSEEMAEKFEVRTSPSPFPRAVAGEVTSPVVPAVAHAPSKKKKKGAPVKTAAVSVAAPSPAPLPIPTRRPAKVPFWLGERVVYDVTYFGTPAGEFSLEVLPYKYVADRKVYHFQGVAKTSALYSLIYKVSDMVETYVDYDGLYSHRFRLLQDESKQYRDTVELNDHDKRQTFYWNRWRPAEGQSGNPHEEKEYGEIEPFSQDWLSMIYYIRAQPLKVGDVLRIPVISEGKMTTTTLSVIRKESLDTLVGEFNTVVVRPEEVATHGVVKKAGESYMWFTDDDRHYFVKAEFRIKVGTVYARVRSIRAGTSPDAQPEAAAGEQSP